MIFYNRLFTKKRFFQIKFFLDRFYSVHCYRKGLEDENSSMHVNLIQYQRLW